jgi:hypothetical protein
MKPDDAKCRCVTGVTCFAEAAAGGTDPCPRPIDAEDLLCAPCRADKDFRHCHTCGPLWAELAEAPTRWQRVRGRARVLRDVIVRGR